MATLLRGFFGGQQPSSPPASIQVIDSDFVEFAGVPTSKTSSLPEATPKPFTKWYNLHERHSPAEFIQEGVILCFLFIIIVIHTLGTNTNRAKAKKLITAYGPILHKEFGLLGFRNIPSNNLEWNAKNVEDIIREKSLSEFSSYATGRLNVAFLDINITLLKRYSPLTLFAEATMSMLFESITAPSEYMEAILYPFDGREADLIPKLPNSPIEMRKETKSAYDAFVWAVVHKDNIKQLRDDRYDISLTRTKDSSKLQNWVTVMSESSEVTEILLTPELIGVIEKAGNLFKYLIISDQPVDQPVKFEDTTSRKRIYLCLKIPSSDDHTNILPLFQYFLRLADFLQQHAHFRPEVLRKIKTTRENAVRKLQKIEEEKKSEQRNQQRDKAKKQKRDIELKALDSKAQKKFLEREMEKEKRKNQKKLTQKR